MDIFRYTDYNDYLSSYYNYKKLRHGFSYSAFAKKAGISSRGYVKLVFDGNRQIGFKALPKFCQGLGLNPKETKYFELMVRLKQADTPEEKKKVYEKLMQFPQRRQVADLEAEHYNYFSKWYFVVIHEMLSLEGCPAGIDEVAEWIEKRTKGEITIKKARDALGQLLKLKLIYQDENRKFKYSQEKVETGKPDVIKLAVQAFQKDMIDRAKEAFIHDLVIREISCLTFAVKKHDIPLMKEKLRKFTAEMDDLFSKSESADTVYQLNLQLFDILPHVENDIKFSHPISDTKH